MILHLSFCLYFVVVLGDVMGCRTLHIFTQRSSATQWLLCSTEMVPTCSKIGTWTPLLWDLLPWAGISWSLGAILLSNTQRLSWSSEHHSRGGGNHLCLERAETVCCSSGVVGNMGQGLVLHSSLSISPLGQGERMLHQEMAHVSQPLLWGGLCP